MRRFYKGNMLVTILLFTFFTLILSSCDVKQSNTPSDKEAKDRKIEKTILPPISPSEGEFIQVFGWINNHTICYAANLKGDYELYTYNLHTGKHTSIFKSEFELANVLINDNYILVYSILSDSEGEIHIIDSTGKKLVAKTIQSHETEFSWNPYNDNEILITTFSAEWESRVYKLEIKESALSEFFKSTPFPQWISDREVMYLDWDQEDPSLYAPLKLLNTETEEEKEINLHSIYFIDKKNEFIITVSSNLDNSNEAIYSFYKEDLEKKASISIPRLSTFSNWLIPNYTIYEDQLLTFVPRKEGNADTYQDGYDLVSINMESGDTTILLPDLDIENQPIQISSDGKYCLYGYYFENLIDTETGEIINLFPSISQS